ncbi:transporter associated domain-containing protein, partial [Streptomyces phytophilus]|uniref:transporter associated domain-containing protein n=1 Tax=Streptomyces phytophilus TaxID=722715 RepID=UPI002868100A
VAGLVAALLGRIPAAGDTAALPGWRLAVRHVDHHRAALVRLVRTADAAPPVPAAAGAGGAEGRAA